MEHKDIVLVGGGIASVSAAARLRSLGFDGTIMLCTRELTIPYHRPPITKQLLHREETDDIHPREWYVQNTIDLRLRAAVTSIDRNNLQLNVSGIGDISFGAVVLATGTTVRRLTVPGSQLDGIHYLKTPRNAATLREEVQKCSRAVIVGGSFLATETACSLASLGLDTTIVCNSPRLLDRLGETLSTFATNEVIRRGIKVIPNRDVNAFTGDSRVDAVHLSDGGTIRTDLVVVGIGSLPETRLAIPAGLDIGATGGIRCDHQLHTSRPNIYAAGDVCEFDSDFHERPVRIEHEKHAGAQGAFIAETLCHAAGSQLPPVMWTELADWLRIDAIGAPSAWDEEVILGDLDSGRFTVVFGDRGRFVGAATTLGPAEVERFTDSLAGSCSLATTLQSVQPERATSPIRSSESARA